MFIACWNEKREQRWDIHAVYNQFSEVCIASEDLKKLGVDPQLIPFIVSTMLRAEQSPNGPPLLSPAEVESLVEALDKVHLPNSYPRTKSHDDQVISSAAVNLSSKNRCITFLREVSSAYGVPLKPYPLSGVALSDTTPYACGGFTGVWKGQQDGNQVCVKAILPRKAANVDKIKRVCGSYQL
jgi:hypothetical protein